MYKNDSHGYSHKACCIWGCPGIMAVCYFVDGLERIVKKRMELVDNLNYCSTFIVVLCERTSCMSSSKKEGLYQKFFGASLHVNVRILFFISDTEYPEKLLICRITFFDYEYCREDPCTSLRQVLFST